MKGISAVIATLLMLIITIALAGVAYTYITGTFTTRTAVVLSIENAVCDPGASKVYVTVRNDGTVDATDVNVTVSGVGTLSSLMTVPAGGVATATINGYASGTHVVLVTSSKSTTSGSVTCP